MQQRIYRPSRYDRDSRRKVRKGFFLISFLRSLRLCGDATRYVTVFMNTCTWCSRCYAQKVQLYIQRTTHQDQKIQKIRSEGETRYQSQ